MPFVAVTTGLGLGARTGIDLPGEATGRIPGRAWKQASWEATKADSCRRARTGYPEVAKTDQKRATYLKALAKENCADGGVFRIGDAVNLSIGQLRDSAQFLDRVRGTLGEFGVDPARIEFEITESTSGGRFFSESSSSTRERTARITASISTDHAGSQSAGSGRTQAQSAES